MNKILVIDYNTGNVDSVVKALKLFEENVIFSFEKKDLESAKKIVLPGQGSYDQAIDELKKRNIRVSLFIEPNKIDIKRAKSLNADCVEIHTGKFCNLVNMNKNYTNELNKIKKAVFLGNKIGLEVHAGHGLTYKSAKILSKVKGIKEFNIGHFLIGESIFSGLANTIKAFKKIIK